MEEEVLFSDLSLEFQEQYENIFKMQKCNVTGIIEKIKVEKEGDCFYKIYFYIKGGKGYYMVNSKKFNGVYCDGNYNLYSNDNMPNKYDKVDLLVYNHSFTVIGNIRNKNNDFTYNGISIKGSFEQCESNLNYIEFYKDYLIIGTGIIFLTVLGIIVFKRFRKNRK